MSLLFAYSSLPPPDFHSSTSITLEKFYELLDLSLTDGMKAKLASIRRLIDVKNILSFQTGVMFDSKGNFHESNLRLSLLNNEDLPEYILDFLEEHKENSDVVKHFPELYSMFFKEEIAKGGVAGEFLTFEKNLILILFGFTGKRLALDIEKYLQYEDLTNPLVIHLLLQKKNSGPFIFPYEYKDLEDRINQTGADPMKQYLSIAIYRFNYYKAIFEEDPCSFRSVCAYMMCLWLLDEKEELNEKLGRKVLIEIVESENE